jgi:hypothetical protein
MPLGKSPESEPVEHKTKETPTLNLLEYHRPRRDLGRLSLASGFRGPARVAQPPSAVLARQAVKACPTPAFRFRCPGP